MADDTEYSAKETERRREAALKRMLATPPKPHAVKAKKGASRPKRARRKASKTA